MFIDIQTEIRHLAVNAKLSSLFYSRVSINRISSNASFLNNLVKDKKKTFVAK